MSDGLILRCSRLIAERKMTLAFAESATAGKLAYEFSLTPDSGTILMGALICYDAYIKEITLGIPHELIEKYTPESAEVTKELARRLYRVIPSASIFVAVTGLTTPGGSETPVKPVGTMFIHAVIGHQDYALRELFTGTPEEIVNATIESVARLLMEKLPDAD